MKKLFISFALLVGVVGTTFAEESSYDFVQDGLCYKITDGKSVSVVNPNPLSCEPGIENKYSYETQPYRNFEPAYSGGISIPTVVVYEGNQYFVTKIGYGAFANCQIYEVKFPHSELEICAGAFYNCAGLTDVSDYNTKNIAEGAFAECMSLGIDNYVRFNYVEEIGDYAFDNCVYLSRIHLGWNLRELGAHVFSQCGRLDEVTLLGDAFEMKDAFEDYQYEYTVLRSRPECYENYKRVSDWNKFQNRGLVHLMGVDDMEIGVKVSVTESVVTVSVENRTDVEVVSLSGTVVYSSSTDKSVEIPLAKGIYFIRLTTSAGTSTSKVVVR